MATISEYMSGKICEKHASDELGMLRNTIASLINRFKEIFQKQQETQSISPLKTL